MGIEKEIKFGSEKPAELFAKIAEECAIQIKTGANGQFNKDNNKSTQIRKFYDELTMWNDRVQSNRIDRNGEFQKLEPFIRMLKAKVAYAKARKHINSQFSIIFDRCIDEVKNAETLREAKLFIEAVIAYCKYEETKNKN